MKESDSHIYVGRTEDGQSVVYAVGGGAVERLGHFAWGAHAPASGIALAHVLLSDASGDAPPADVSRRFAVQVIQRLPADAFALPRDTVNAWLRRVGAQVKP